MPQLRRARKAVRLGQADEVFKPFDFHGADYRLPAIGLHDEQIYSNFLNIFGTGLQLERDLDDKLDILAQGGRLR
jgi:hypothetical protein